MEGNSDASLTWNRFVGVSDGRRFRGGRGGGGGGGGDGGRDDEAGASPRD